MSAQPDMEKGWRGLEKANQMGLPENPAIKKRPSITQHSLLLLHAMQQAALPCAKSLLLLATCYLCNFCYLRAAP